jgi:hypothetical protein
MQHGKAKLILEDTKALYSLWTIRMPAWDTDANKSQSLPDPLALMPAHGHNTCPWTWIYEFV